MPKRDPKDEVREFVETRRKHEAMSGIQTGNTEHLPKFFGEQIIFGL